MKKTPRTKKPGLLLVANWDSNVGYAWWLMESYWVEIEKLYGANHNVHLCYPSISTLPTNIQNSNITIHKFSIFPSNGNLLQQCFFLYQNNIQCIYFSDQPALSWTYPLYRLCGVKKIIVHDHCPGLRTKPQRVKKLIKSIIMRLPFVTANAHIGATQFVQQRAIDVTRIPPTKTYHVANGIPTEYNKEHINNHKYFDIPEDRLIMVSTGRANHYKGIPFVLNCMAELIHQRKCKNLHFLFCGDGPNLKEFQQQAHSLNISEYVTLAGRQNEVDKILNASDFAIHPSQGEVGYSLSILEYMRAALPVIVSNNPSVCSATEHKITGLIYTANDIYSGCEQILTVLNDADLRSKMGTSAQQRFQKKYSLQKTHESLHEVMQSIYPLQ